METETPSPSVHRRHWLRYALFALLALIIAGLVAARIYLDVWAKDYVNRVLNNIPGYKGSIEAIDIDLYRGAYRIEKLKILKKQGSIPVPFIDIDVVDFSIEWRALFHGRIVSSADLEKPVLNFAVNRAGTSEQTGVGVDWTKPIKELMPIDINKVTFRNGKLTYQDFSTKPKADLYITNMSGEARNLRNVVDENKPLPSTLVVKGNSIGGGALAIDAKLNILKPTPDMDLNLKLEKVNLPALSNYTDAYANIDIRKGRLDLYSELGIQNGYLKGYVKPIATDVAIIDLKRTKNPLKLAWEATVATVVKVFTNIRHDQFATRIPIEGNLKDVRTDTLATIGGIIRNAFLGAFKRGFDRDFGKDEPADLP